MLLLFAGPILGVLPLASAQDSRVNPTLELVSVEAPADGWNCDEGTSVTITYSASDPDNDLSFYRFTVEGPAGATGDAYQIIDSEAFVASPDQPFGPIESAQITVGIPAEATAGEWLVTLNANDSIVDFEPHFDSSTTATFTLNPCLASDPAPPELTLTNIAVDITNTCVGETTGSAILTLTNAFEVTRWSVIASLENDPELFLYGSEEVAPQGSFIEDFTREVGFSVPKSFPRGRWQVYAVATSITGDITSTAESFALPDCPPTPEPTAGATPTATAEATPTPAATPTRLAAPPSTIKRPATPRPEPPLAAATAEPTVAATSAAPTPDTADQASESAISVQTANDLPQTGSDAANTTLVGVTLLFAGIALASLSYAGLRRH